MATNEGSLLIFAGADRTVINLVGLALGRGEDSLSRTFAATPNPEWDAEPAGWYAWAVGGNAVYTSWASIVGQAPTLNDEGYPIYWDMYGITQAEAQAACEQLSVYAYASEAYQGPFIASTAAALDPPLYVTPDPPL